MSDEVQLVWMIALTFGVAKNYQIHRKAFSLMREIMKALGHTDEELDG